MATRPCGRTTETCGCCEGTRVLTPMPTFNRPGLDALRYRVGTHGTFFESMKARLASVEVVAPGADGQTLETFRPLQGLTTRDTGDAAIGLLDAWATVGDVLTFYQERVANEGYLRTATERRSVLELARLVGYALRPGVASTVFLAYTLEDKQLDPVTIPAGARSQSVPGPDEQPQSFETSEALIARTEWSNLQARLKKPQNITLENALGVDTMYIAGISANLKKGDLLLWVFGDDGDPSVLRTVDTATAQSASDRTEVRLHPVAPAVVAALPALVAFVAAATPLTAKTNQTPEGRMLLQADELLNAAYKGLPSSPMTWADELNGAADEPVTPPFAQLVQTLDESVTAALATLPPAPPPPTVTDPSQFVGHLLKPRVPQAASALRLSRSLGGAFQSGADLQPQLLVNFAPELKDSFYLAWSNAAVNPTPPALKAVYVFRASAPLFGSSVAKQPLYFTSDSDQLPAHLKGQLMPQSAWLEWSLEGESETGMFLDQAHEEILPASYVMIQRARSADAVHLVRDVRRVAAAQTAQRTAYGLSGKTTRLAFEKPWWFGMKDLMSTLRATLVYGQSERLFLADEPISDVVKGREIPLGRLYNELTSGRWVIFSGERADIPGVSGVKTSELLMISGLRQDFDLSLPGDTTHTTLLLATDTAYAYKRDTLTIYGNVVKATHGETRRETLGGGDGSRPFQSFTLKQPRLTFVPAPVPAGVESTLAVYVNDVQWHEADTLADAKPKDRVFITKTDDASNTTTIFGNGEEGARLPTGVENVKAAYRNGLGRPGNVIAEQISLLQTRPQGVKNVVNPLRASGGADKESRDQARENAPLAVMSLDRLVSVQDYADFTRTFAGIGKADARRVSDGRRELVHITIAGADDIPVDPVSDLYRNLLIALRRYGDAAVPVQVGLRELVVLVLSANLRLAADYQWESVVQQVRTALLDAFGFGRRALGQPARLSEAISLIQNVAGVAYVDVDVFGGIPEKIANADGTRRLLSLEEMTDAVKHLVDPGGVIGAASSRLSQRVDVNLADFERGAVRPAQLAIFTPAVADTMTLNQVL
jgi:Baseplate J-like protein